MGLNRSSFRFSTIAAAAILLAAGSGIRMAKAGEVDIDAKAHEVAKSLVAVEFMLQNENTSQEGSGQGIVISKDGVILVSGELISEGTPHEWVKEIKVRLPSKNFANPVTAKLLGRTRDGLFAFLKTEQPIDAPVFEPGDIEQPKLGEAIFSVGLMGKDAGYGTYVGVSRAKAILDLRHVAVRSASFGLTNPNSPVFDAETGKLVGLTMGNTWDGMIMQSGRTVQAVRLLDSEQGFEFYPEGEIAPLFKDVPTSPFMLRRAWLGVDEVTGLQENLVALKKLEQPSGVMLGVIIPNESGEKGGLKSQDIVLTVDGKEFSKTPVPAIMVEHFYRAVETHKPGDVVTLGVLRDGQKEDVKVTLGTYPKSAAEMPYVYSQKIGIVTRDLVFTDAYARKLPQDTKGVIVALVKNGTPASLGSTPLHAAYLITKVDDQPVENQAQFETLMKKIDDNPNAKEAVFVVIQPNGENEVCRIDLSK